MVSNNSKAILWPRHQLVALVTLICTTLAWGCGETGASEEAESEAQDVRRSASPEEQRVEQRISSVLIPEGLSLTMQDGVLGFADQDTLHPLIFGLYPDGEVIMAYAEVGGSGFALSNMVDLAFKDLNFRLSPNADGTFTVETVPSPHQMSRHLDINTVAMLAKFSYGELVEAIASRDPGRIGHALSKISLMVDCLRLPDESTDSCSQPNQDIQIVAVNKPLARIECDWGDAGFGLLKSSCASSSVVPKFKEDRNGDRLKAPFDSLRYFPKPPDTPESDTCNDTPYSSSADVCAPKPKDSDKKDPDSEGGDSDKPADKTPPDDDSNPYYGQIDEAKFGDFRDSLATAVSRFFAELDAAMFALETELQEIAADGHTANTFPGSEDDQYAQSLAEDARRNAKDEILSKLYEVDYQLSETEQHVEEEVENLNTAYLNQVSDIRYTAAMYRDEALQNLADLQLQLTSVSSQISSLDPDDPYENDWYDYLAEEQNRLIEAVAAAQQAVNYAQDEYNKLHSDSFYDHLSPQTRDSLERAKQDVLDAQEKLRIAESYLRMWSECRPTVTFQEHNGVIISQPQQQCIFPGIATSEPAIDPEQCDSGLPGWIRYEGGSRDMVAPCGTSSSGWCSGEGFEYVRGTGWCRPI